MSFHKQVKKSMNELQASYQAGLQNYPRVENTYIKNNDTFDFFPHKPLKPYSIFLTPIKKQKIKLNKKTSLLFLSEQRMITPAQADDFAKTIDEFFDADLNFINNNKKLELQNLFTLVNKFLENEFKTRDAVEQKNKFININKNIYKQNKLDNLIKFYRVPKIKLIPMGNKKTTSPTEILTSIKKDNNNILDNFSNLNCLQEVFEDFTMQSNYKRQQKSAIIKQIEQSKKQAFNFLIKG